jgi:hypothetical protein
MSETLFASECAPLSTQFSAACTPLVMPSSAHFTAPETAFPTSHAYGPSRWT